MPGVPGKAGFTLTRPRSWPAPHCAKPDDARRGKYLFQNIFRSQAFTPMGAGSAGWANSRRISKRPSTKRRESCHLQPQSVPSRAPCPTASACRAPSAVGPEATWMRSHWGAGVANERSARRCPGSVPTTTTGCAPLWPISTTRRRSILAAQGHRAHGQRYPLPGHVGYPSPLLGEPMDSQRACVPTPSCPWPKPS